jgi:hypothetical protein
MTPALQRDSALTVARSESRTPEKERRSSRYGTGPCRAANSPEREDEVGELLFTGVSEDNCRWAA